MHNAQEVLGDETSSRLGPIPLTSKSSDRRFLDQILTHDIGDIHDASWRHLSTFLTTSVDLGTDVIPAALRPTSGDGPINVFRDEGWIAVSDHNMLWIIDVDQGRALRWSPTVEDLPPWEAGKPLRFALRAWSTVHNAAILHAAAIAGSRGATLLVGPGGTGKSTTAMACMGQGLRILADDYCIVESSSTESRTSTVYPTYLIANLDERSLQLLPHLRDRVAGVGPRNKFLVPLDPLGSKTPHAPLRFLCTIVRREGEQTRLEHVSRAEALRMLAPSSVFQIPGLGKETWESTMHIMRSLETYRLVIGNLTDVPHVLHELLGELPPC